MHHTSLNQIMCLSNRSRSNQCQFIWLIFHTESHCIQRRTPISPTKNSHKNSTINLACLLMIINIHVYSIDKITQEFINEIKRACELYAIKSGNVPLSTAPRWSTVDWRQTWWIRLIRLICAQTVRLVKWHKAATVENHLVETNVAHLRPMPTANARCDRSVLFSFILGNRWETSTLYTDISN